MFAFNEKAEHNGVTKWVRRTQKIAPVSDKYRTEASVRHLAHEILSPINSQRVTRVEGTQTVTGFIEDVYMPHVKQTLRPATEAAYQRCYNLVKDHLGEIELREFDVPTADRVLNDVAKRQLAHTTHRNVRNFLSGAFRYALRLGAIRHGNPIRDAVVPKGKPKGVLHAYTVEEIQAILKVLPEPARTVVLVAALSGLRHSEIRGLKWEDFTGQELHVRRSVWNTHIGETKTLNSAAPVPVLPILAKALEKHRKRSVGEFIFSGSTGKPLVLVNTVRREIRPALKKKNLQWHGFHAFRRGLASNLYALGVAPRVIQGILRHANIATTMAHYVQTAPVDAHEAMKKIEKAFQ
jgi:integrase